MKNTAYGKPILINQNNNVTILNQVETLSETSIQDIIFNHPECLPISDIDESFNPVIPVCKELNTSVGPLDILMISPNGGLIIIETKLWRNPEARRTVVAQILDYATALSQWSYEDLQREVSRKLNRKGNTLYDIVKDVDSYLLLPESDFVDSVSRNLSQGKFLLLVAGDGIREGADRIAEFLSSTGHMNYTFAMVELSIYEADSIGTIIMPKIVVRTVELQKLTVELPDGLSIVNSTGNEQANNIPARLSPEKEEEREFYIKFWKEFVSDLVLDDPGQPYPMPANGHNLYIYPGPTKKLWISAYFMKSKKRVGVYFRYQDDQEGKMIHNELDQDKEAIKQELGNDVLWSWEDIGGGAGVRLDCEDVFAPDNRELIINFFQEWINNFVNVLRPRLKGLK